MTGIKRLIGFVAVIAAALYFDISEYSLVLDIAIKWIVVSIVFVVLFSMVASDYKELKDSRQDETDQYWYGYNDAMSLAALGKSTGQIEYELLAQNHSESYKNGVRQYLKHH